jgi:hypothetical protein
MDEINNTNIQSDFLAKINDYDHLKKFIFSEFKRSGVITKGQRLLSTLRLAKISYFLFHNNIT